MIDNIDKRILFELDRNARISDTQLGKIVLKSKDSVRYRITKLEESGVVKKYKTWIDSTKFGYKTSTVYLSILNLGARKKSLISELKKQKNVYWYGVAEGVWNIGITYFVKSNDELFEIKNKLLGNYGDLITDLKFTSLASISSQDKGFLVEEKTEFKTFSDTVLFENIDSVGKKVLSKLYFNSRMNLSDLAHECFSTIDIVRKRMKDYEAKGIIVKYTIEIDYKKIGYDLYKAFVYVNDCSKKEFDKILSYAKKDKSIINIVKQIASWDLELIIFSPSFSEYLETIEGLTKINPTNFKKIETSIMSEDVIFPCAEVCL